MPGIHKKLQHWQAQGLLSAEQAAAILTHEQGARRGRFTHGMTGLAVFAIGIGILSIIAANWAMIPAGVKLGAHFAVNAGLAVALWRMRARDLWREGLALLLSALTLTLIALIGQVFQLGGSYGAALLVWLVAALPMLVLFGRTRMSVIPGLLALVFGGGVIVFDLTRDLPDLWIGVFVLMFYVLFPLALMADGHVRIFRRWRPCWARMMQRTGWIMLTLGASAATVFWYGDRLREMGRMAGNAGVDTGTAQAIYLGVFVIAALAMAVHWALYRNDPEAPESYRMGMIHAGVSVALMALPVMVPGVESGALAAILFLLYWGFIGWWAQISGAFGLLSLAIFVMAARIYVVYLEAFGGLMSGGFGLISGGVVMLVMIAAARKVNARLKKDSQKGAVSS